MTDTGMAPPAADNDGDASAIHDAPPFIPTDAKETDETDETYSVTNREFLEAIFGPETGHACPMVVSFIGNPAKPSKGAWNGEPWRLGTKIALPLAANNYFSLATFRPDDAGKHRRRKSHFAGLYAILLDDIGTKVPSDRLKLEPSWMLETSPGNFQAGYILDEPITDTYQADRLMKAIVQAQLSDPGANGPTARLARLPEGQNGKHEPSFVCRLHHWNSDYRYSPEDLREGLELDFHKSHKSGSNKRKQRREQSDYDNTVHIPKPDNNPIIAALQERGLYKHPLGGGKHDITCPWVAEHTDVVDGGTAYFEPNDEYQIGGFKCFHGHCTGRHIGDLLEFLSIESSAARMMPVIRVVPGEMPHIVDAAESELAKTNRYYQRGGLIVTVITDPGTKETSVREIIEPSLMNALASVATWEKYDKRSDAWVRIDPPKLHTTILFAANEYKNMPVLRGLVRQPYLQPGGKLTTTPGYDPSTGMYGLFDEQDFVIPDNPTEADARAALALIDDLLSDFPFQRPTDRSAALTACFTATLRPTLPCAPMFHIRAHQIASGKSYLCSVIKAFATSQGGTPMTFPGDDDECRKLLLAELLRSPAVIEFDNLTSDLLAHKSLCIVLTSESFTGRILGISKTASVSTNALFLSSGNNVGPIQDMTRRCLTISIDPACEMPATRTFSKPNLVEDTRQNRGLYISAVLTIIRAYILAGSPQTECKPIAGYGDWSYFCRQPLLWLGQPDPAEAFFEAMADDPDRDTLSRLLLAWQACFGSKPTMVRQAVNVTQSDVCPWSEDLREIMNDIAADRDVINRRVLGRWIKRNSGRIINGLRFMRASGSRSAEAWYVESVL